MSSTTDGIEYTITASERDGATAVWLTVRMSPGNDIFMNITDVPHELACDPVFQNAIARAVAAGLRAQNELDVRAVRRWAPNRLFPPLVVWHEPPKVKKASPKKTSPRKKP